MPPSDEVAARLAGAAVFTQPDVVASYHARQPYAPGAYERLLASVPGRGRALDIGCGPGFMTGELAARFDEVVAVDPSRPMIAVAKATCPATNVHWVCARAEDFETEDRFDLAIAGSSIHWTDPALLFPKLARWTEVFATIDNDPLFPDPPPPCGLDAWVDFLTRWNARLDRPTPHWWRDLAERPPPRAMPWDPWIDVVHAELFRFDFRQSVADFIASCHARVSWPPAVMGDAVIAEFDADLRALLSPHADGGLLKLDVITALCWGAPRATPRE